MAEKFCFLESLGGARMNTVIHEHPLPLKIWKIVGGFYTTFYLTCIVRPNQAEKRV